MIRKLKRIAFVVVVAAIVIAAIGGLTIYSGAYPVAATEQHTKPVYWALKAMMRQAVRHRASGIEVPVLDDARLIARGRVFYDSHCVRCHGAPGVAPEPFALGMTPAPGNLAQTSLDWPMADIYWTIKHGLKMTGMPAWAFRMSDDELWAIVAYVRIMARETPQQYALALDTAKKTVGAAGITTSQPPPTSMEGDPERGKIAVQQYACGTCHEISGITGATVPVGPPLTHIATRPYVGGLLANHRDNMVRWLRAPQDVHPGSAMPNLGVTEADARDIAAYLYHAR